jgi:ABC-2 type transport system ATP-binding protein
MDSRVAIKTTGLSKSFGDNRAVDDLNLEIRKGELYGLVGPDGAGKSTTMRLLTSIMEPTAGDAWIFGDSVISQAARISEKVGYLSQRFGLYEDLTVMENIHFYADLFDVTKEERAPRIERLLGFSNLTPFKDRLAGRLSGGMKQKLGLACALVHTPEVLFLDEPTNGVDPVSRRDFWRILYDLLKNDVTIIVSTAYLDEAERCTRIGLMHQGRILVEDEPKAVRKTLNRTMLELWPENARSARNAAKRVAGVGAVNRYGDRLHVMLEEHAVRSDVLDGMQKAGIGIRDAREILPSLEDVFISLVDGMAARGK